MSGLYALPKRGTKEYRRALSRPQRPPELSAQVSELLSAVRLRGDEAVGELTLRFKGGRREHIEVDPREVSAALREISPSLRGALSQAAENIAQVHAAQFFSEREVVVGAGVRVWRSWRPLDRVGLYVPGGRTSYPSSVLMLAVPARLARCPEIVLCSPPGSDGNIAAPVLAAAALAGVTEVWAVGGVQGIAALAYGTESLAKVDKIFGPGNAWVTEAKRQVFGEVAVDMPAGPSEVVVVTDGSAPATFVAADLEAQAEHAPDAIGILLSSSESLALDVSARIRPELVSQVRVFTVETVADAIEFVNDFGPEHVILACAQPKALLETVRNAGSVFLGPMAPAAIGDYASGANHVIPTGGSSRGFSALGLEAFGHTLQIQSLSATGLARLAPVAEPIARAESFLAHWRSIAVRLEGDLGEERPVPEPRASVASMHPYLWESSTAEIADRAGVSPGDVIRFDTNTCPFQLVGAKGLEWGDLAHYPDSTYAALTASISAYTSAPTEAITVGAGADEILALIARTYIAPGDPVVILDPSYAMFRALSEAEGGRIEYVASDNLEELASRCRRARVSWICNPNNPTGKVLAVPLLAELARESSGVVVIDEAYFEFCGMSAAPRIAELPNLVVVRTLSKAFGLASARVGYALSSPEVAIALARVRPPASISGLSAALGVRALAAAREMRKEVDALLAEKDRLAQQLEGIGLAVQATATNFLLVGRPEGLAEALSERAMVVRTFPDISPLAGWMRVTVRSEKENASLVAACQTWAATSRPSMSSSSSR